MEMYSTHNERKSEYNTYQGTIKTESANVKPSTHIKILWLKKLKILCHGDVEYKALMEKKCLEYFMKKNCKRQNKESIELKKQSREKVINYKPNGKVKIIQ